MYFKITTGLFKLKFNLIFVFSRGKNFWTIISAPAYFTNKEIVAKHTEVTEQKKFKPFRRKITVLFSCSFNVLF